MLDKTRNKLLNNLGAIKWTTIVSRKLWIDTRFCSSFTQLLMSRVARACCFKMFNPAHFIDKLNKCLYEQLHQQVRRATTFSRETMTSRWYWLAV